MAEPFKHIYKVDLNQPLKRFDVGDILASGDEKANSFEVTVCRDGVNVDLSGCTVLAYFIRPNDETMTVDGTANGSKAIVEPSKNCYVYDGEFSLAIKLVGSGITQTVAVFDGRIVRTTSENIVDGDRVIYGLEDLLAQIAATEAAANSANTAAGKANTATQNANTATSNANSATSAANSAADRANAAANNWENGIAANASKLGGKAPEYYVQPVNLLDNSDFCNPVNQRGQTSYTTAGYTIDRWYSYDGLSLTVSPFSFSGREINQLIAGTFSGIYTLAAKKTDGTLLIKTAEISNTYSWSDSSLAFGVTNGNTRISIPPAGYEWAALYEGTYTAETLPPYVPKGYTAELAECQRYYYQLAPGYQQIGFGCVDKASHTALRISVPIPQVMRTSPTVTIDDISKWRITNGSVSVAPSEISAVQYSYNSAFVVVNFNLSSAFGGTGATVLHCTEGNNRLMMSADL